MRGKSGQVLRGSTFLGVPSKKGERRSDEHLAEGNRGSGSAFVVILENALTPDRLAVQSGRALRGGSMQFPPTVVSGEDLRGGKSKVAEPGGVRGTQLANEMSQYLGGE